MEMLTGSPPSRAGRPARARRPPTAALLNAVAANVFDLDDTHVTIVPQLTAPVGLPVRLGQSGKGDGCRPHIGEGRPGAARLEIGYADAGVRITRKQQGTHI